MSPILTLLDRTASVVTKDLREIATITAGTFHGGSRLLTIEVQAGQEAELIRRVHLHVYRDHAIVPKEGNTPFWSNIADLYYQDGTSLLHCVREFRATHMHLHDSLSSRGACGVTSHEFVRVLNKRRVHLGPTDVVGGPYKAAHHYFVRAGNLGVDWTARQFHKAAPVPFIFRIPPALTAWRDVGRHHGLMLQARAQSTQEPSL